MDQGRFGAASVDDKGSLALEVLSINAETKTRTSGKTEAKTSC
jgi:hypothetical protein